VFGRLRAEIRRRLLGFWTRIDHSGARLGAGEPSGTNGFERFMSEFEARGRIQQYPPKERNARRR